MNFIKNYIILPILNLYSTSLAIKNLTNSLIKGLIMSFLNQIKGVVETIPGALIYMIYE